jgi:hypothetical protein
MLRMCPQAAVLLLILLYKYVLLHMCPQAAILLLILVYLCPQVRDWSVLRLY